MGKTVQQCSLQAPDAPPVLCVGVDWLLLTGRWTYEQALAHTLVDLP